MPPQYSAFQNCLQLTPPYSCKPCAYELQESIEQPAR